MGEEVKAKAARIGVEKGEAKKQLKIDYHVTFGTEAGQRVLADIEKMARYHVPMAPIDGTGRVDEKLLLIQTGERNLCTLIFKKLGILDKQDNHSGPERK